MSKDAEQLEQLIASQRTEATRSAWASLPDDVRALVQRLSARCAESLALELHRLATDTEERARRYGRCQGFIEAASHRDELDYSAACVLLDYATRLELAKR
ncbi:hypothetical protein [Pseudomonas brassicacearum]|uniref:Uncharacterized protein n=1 Tax=Pseudomonas brassicacearum TaxID=930166 RepID=A0A423JJH4_9PSED|nr:hypothetical protein [Pseudomonas brassicacearum]RON37860.1 hypothetical protein BK664_15680 [Pseudomonas brassicacearum]